MGQPGRVLRRDGLNGGMHFGCFGRFFGERCGVRGGFLAEDIERLALLPLGLWNRAISCKLKQRSNFYIFMQPGCLAFLLFSGIDEGKGARR